MKKSSCLGVNCTSSQTQRRLLVEDGETFPWDYFPLGAPPGYSVPQRSLLFPPLQAGSCSGKLTGGVALYKVHRVETKAYKTREEREKITDRGGVGRRTTAPRLAGSKISRAKAQEAAPRKGREEAGSENGNPLFKKRRRRQKV